MNEPKLPHCERMRDLLRRRGMTEAKRAHNAHVKAQFDAAQRGRSSPQRPDGREGGNRPRGTGHAAGP